MSEYVKQTWEDGVSPVNAERLNHMEEGIANAGGGGGGVFTVNVTHDPDKFIEIADKTCDEIEAAMKQGKCVQVLYVMSDGSTCVCPLSYVDEKDLYGKIFKFAHFIFLRLDNGVLAAMDMQIRSDGEIVYGYTQ